MNLKYIYKKMSTIEFNFEGNLITIQCTPEEKMGEIIKRLITKLGNKKKEELYFLYGGGMLDENLTFNEQANENDKKRNIMSIIVNKKIDDEDESLKKSEYIICPECKECSRIKVDNYKFGFYDCKNNHKINNISINDFENTQNINESKIKCENCNKINKSTSYNNVFFICYDCKKNICQLCKTYHDKTHNIIDYDYRFFTCDIHYEAYYTYCMDCKKDLCVTCEMEHEGHKIINYGNILPNIKKVKEETNKFNNKKEELKNDIREIINKLNNLIYSIDNYYSIYQDIINSYGNKKRNYFLLQNIHDMIKYNNIIIEDINKIKNEINISIKINNIFDIYDKMNPLNKNDESTNKEEDIKNDINNENKSKEEEIKEKEKEYKKEINNNNQISNDEDIHKNNKIIEINNELFLKSEKNENNDYKDFDVSKMKKILTFKTEIHNIHKIFVLKDGRVFICGQKKNSYKYFYYIFDLKNDNILNLKFNDLKDKVEVVQMDDGIVAIFENINSKMILIDIKYKDFKIIQTLDTLDRHKSGFFKLINQKIIVFDSDFQEMIIYIYENKKLKLINKKTISSTEKYSFCKYIYLINEKEIALIYYQEGCFFDLSYYIGFFDLEKDIKIKSFDYHGAGVSCLINENLFIYSSFNKLYPVNLKNHSNKNGFEVENMRPAKSIFTLNEKQFIVSDDYAIYQFELEKNNDLTMIHKINLKNSRLLKYPKNRLIINDYKEDSNEIYLYF